MRSIFTVIATVIYHVSSLASPLNHMDKISLTKIPIKPLQRTEMEAPPQAQLFVPQIDPKAVHHTKGLADLSKVDRRLSTFAAELRSFAPNDSFDFLAFDRLADVLNLSFMSISDSYEDLEFRSKSLRNKYRFIKIMFHVMEEACGHMISAAPSDDPIHEVIAKIYHLRISIMMMLNDFGGPDTEMENYSEKVHDFEARIRNFGENYYSMLSGASPTALMLVWDQYHKVESILRSLSYNLP